MEKERERGREREMGRECACEEERQGGRRGSRERCREMRRKVKLSFIVPFFWEILSLLLTGPGAGEQVCTHTSPAQEIWAHEENDGDKRV